MVKRLLAMVGLGLLLASASVRAAAPRVSAPTAPFRHVVLQTSANTEFTLTSDSHALVTYENNAVYGSSPAVISTHTSDPYTDTTLVVTGTYSLVTTASTGYYIGDDGLIYQVPVDGGTPSVLTTPYSSTQPPSSPPLELLYEPYLYLSPDEQHLFYRTVRERDSTTNAVVAVDIHSVDLTTEEDQIINGSIGAAPQYDLHITAHGAVFFRDATAESLYVAEQDGSVTLISAPVPHYDAAVYPLHSVDEALLITKNGQDYSIVRFDVATKTSTPLVDAGTFQPVILVLSPDEQSMIALLNSTTTFFKVNTSTGAQEPLPMLSSASEIEFFDQTHLLFTENSTSSGTRELYEYDFQSQNTSLIVDVTDYGVLINHAGTAVLLRSSYCTGVSLCWVDGLEYIDLATNARTLIYDATANPIRVDNQLPFLITFSPNDQFIVFRQLTSTGVIYHGLFLDAEFAPVDQSYLPMLLN